MIDRAERTGFGVALVGHAALLVALTVGLATAGRIPPPSDAIEVSFVDEIGLVAATPAPTEEPPPAAAPDAGPPEEIVPEPSPAPQPRPELRQVAPSPSPTAQPKPREQTPRRPRQTAPRRDNLPDIDSFGREPSRSRSTAPRAEMTGQAAASIAQAIARQVQPCADRQVYPGPGSERITTPIALRLNRDGSLAAPPRVGEQSGLDNENRRYARRVADLAVAAFVECAPMRNLPAELYDVPRGWSNFTMNYRLPG